MGPPSAEPSALSAEALRAVDRHAEEVLHLPGVVLMENAGAGAARIALEMLAESTAPTHATCLVLCGGGGNGGDGYVVARHLALAGRRVFVVHATENSSKDAAVMREVVERMGLDQITLASEESLKRFEACARGKALHDGSERCALIVDALLGTGFRGAMRPVFARLLQLAQEWAAVRHGRAGTDDFSAAGKLALDLPSGMMADKNGEGDCPVFTADRTATFAAPKLSFALPGAERWTGQVEICSIGAPLDLSSGGGLVSSRDRS